jgi:predicted nucleic acid-binding protein
VTVVADSSPLIILAKLGCFDLLERLYPRVYISEEVHNEVVVAGAGLPGASEVSKAKWIRIKPVQSRLQTVRKSSLLGLGELSSILLAKELDADAVLLDDRAARKLQDGNDLKFAAALAYSRHFTCRTFS